MSLGSILNVIRELFRLIWQYIHHPAKAVKLIINEYHCYSLDVQFVNFRAAVSWKNFELEANENCHN